MEQFIEELLPFKYNDPTDTEIYINTVSEDEYKSIYVDDDNNIDVYRTKIYIDKKDIDLLITHDKYRKRIGDLYYYSIVYIVHDGKIVSKLGVSEIKDVGQKPENIIFQDIGINSISIFDYYKTNSFEYPININTYMNSIVNKIGRFNLLEINKKINKSDLVKRDIIKKIHDRKFNMSSLKKLEDPYTFLYDLLQLKSGDTFIHFPYILTIKEFNEINKELFYSRVEHFFDTSFNNMASGSNSDSDSDSDNNNDNDNDSDSDSDNNNDNDSDSDDSNNSSVNDSNGKENGVNDRENNVNDNDGKENGVNDRENNVNDNDGKGNGVNDRENNVNDNDGKESGNNLNGEINNEGDKSSSINNISEGINLSVENNLSEENIDIDALLVNVRDKSSQNGNRSSGDNSSQNDNRSSGDNSSRDNTGDSKFNNEINDLLK